MGDRVTGVSCYVDSCHYWGAGQVCQADQIVVDNGRGRTGGKGSYSMEVGEIGKGSSEATTSSETMCQTFKPKSGSGSGSGQGGRGQEGRSSASQQQGRSSRR